MVINNKRQVCNSSFTVAVEQREQTHSIHHNDKVWLMHCNSMPLHFAAVRWSTRVSFHQWTSFHPCVQHKLNLFLHTRKKNSIWLHLGHFYMCRVFLSFYLIYSGPGRGTPSIQYSRCLCPGSSQHEDVTTQFGDALCFYWFVLHIRQFNCIQHLLPSTLADFFVNTTTCLSIQYIFLYVYTVLFYEKMK